MNGLYWTLVQRRLRTSRKSVAYGLLTIDARAPPTEPELQLLHRWLGSWRGIGDVVAGMARQDYDLQFGAIRIQLGGQPLLQPR
jgi:hypothetical protein